MFIICKAKTLFEFITQFLFFISTGICWIFAVQKVISAVSFKSICTLPSWTKKHRKKPYLTYLMIWASNFYLKPCKIWLFFIFDEHFLRFLADFWESILDSETLTSYFTHSILPARRPYFFIFTCISINLDLFALVEMGFHFVEPKKSKIPPPPP